MRVNALSHLLDLGHRLQRHDITLPVEPAPARSGFIAAGTPDTTPEGLDEDGPNGRSPWLLHAMRDDRPAPRPAVEAEPLARLLAIFVRAHGRPAE
jgi:hypothetical protein